MEKNRFKKIHSQVMYFLLVIITVLLPVHHKYLGHFLGLIFVLQLFTLGEQKFKEILNYPVIILTICLYFMHAISCFYSDNKSVALFDLEVKLSLLIFPFIAFFDNNFNRKNLTKYFIIGVWISVLLNVLIAFIEYIETGDINNFFYVNFSHFLHPSYLAIVLNIAIILIFDKIYKSKKHLLVNLLQLVVLSLVIFLVSSKAGLLGLIIIYFVFFVKILFNRNIKRYLKVGLFLSFLLISILISNNSRVDSLISKVFLVENSTTNEGNLRIKIWKSSIDVVVNQNFFGEGNGDVKQLLEQEYENNGFITGITQKYNCHNQFLQILIGTGFIGLLLFISIFVFSLILAVKNKDSILLIFTILMIVNFLFESMLETRSGNFIFAYFISFLICKKDK